MSDEAAANGAIRVAVLGASGRMGRVVAARVSESPDIALAGGIASRDRDAGAARAAGFPTIAATGTDAAAAIVREARVVIDFSTPAGLAAFIDAHAADLDGRAVVTGTTGLDADAAARLDALGQRAAVLAAPNFSIGVNVLLALVTHAAGALAPDAYDVEIVEAHHGAKADAPSGTALALGAAAARARQLDFDAVRTDGRSGRVGARPAGQIGIHAVRGGGVAGEHRVMFLGARERLELAHEALDRALFADGAIAAARWIAGRPPGRYHMADVLGL